MNNYFSAYNDVEDDLEDFEEEKLTETEQTTETYNVVETKENEEQIETDSFNPYQKHNYDISRGNEEVNNESDNSERKIENEVIEDNNEINEENKMNNSDDESSKDEDGDFVISDEDGDFFRLRKRSREETNHVRKEEEKGMLLEAKIAKRSVPSRLVSYGEDEDDEEAVGQLEDHEVDEVAYEDTEFTAIIIGTPNEEIEIEDEVVRMDERVDDPTRNIKLPPRVPTRCSKAMQDKVTFLHKKVTQEDMDLNFSIQGKKNFRNPSIYEKLLEYCHIDEQGTNYPPHLYNPSIFGPESNYKALAEAQNENERRKKEQKQKRTLEKSQAAKKTSKWDNPITHNINNSVINADPSIKKVPSVGSLIKTKSS